MSRGPRWKALRELLVERGGLDVADASEEQRIPKAAADLIRPGEAVGLTRGTTTPEVARALAVRADLPRGVSGWRGAFSPRDPRAHGVDSA